MVNPIEIRPVSGRRDLRDFLNLPYELNADRPLWVPPLRSEQRRELDPRRNPFYEHATAQLYMCYRGARGVGRIAAIENRRHNEHWKDRVGFFGYYEAIDDPEVSLGLFAAAESWLRGQGLQRMRGPTNPCMNSNVGFLTEGFEYAPAIPMPYTQPFYPAQAEDFGLQRAMEVLVYVWDYAVHSIEDHIGPMMPRIRRLADYVERKGKIAIRGPRMDNIDDELSVIREICNESLKDNWGFVPLTDAEIRAARRELEKIIDPEMFFFAEVDGRPEAVFLACPDYNQLLARMNGRIWPFGWWTYLKFRKKIRKYVVYVYASTPRAEAMGVGAALYRRFYESCFRKGIKQCETGYVLSNNTLMRNSIEKFGAKVGKRYQLYEKAISPPASDAHDR